MRIFVQFVAFCGQADIPSFGLYDGFLAQLQPFSIFDQQTLGGYYYISPFRRMGVLGQNTLAGSLILAGLVAEDVAGVRASALYGLYF